jgi:hypothetical protein
MNKILRLFPVVMLESVLEDHQPINEKLINEINIVFDNLEIYLTSFVVFLISFMLLLLIINIIVLRM